MYTREMDIVGRGLQSIVTIHNDDPALVNKFYLTEEEWSKEKANLQFVAGIQKQGLKLDCKVPNISTSEQGKWQIGGKEYRYLTAMERIVGKRADSDFDPETLKIFGTHLGVVLFSMHRGTKKYSKQWTSEFGEQDELLTHLFEDKAAKVLKEEKNQKIKLSVKEASAYLKGKESMLLSNRTLSHLDLNLTNIIINNDNQVEGLVDWVSFGFTNPSLSMYQLATKTHIWKYVEGQYAAMGEEIMNDVVYAAATIHLAWAPIICKELDFPLPEDETREKFEEMYENFNRYKI